MVSKRIGTVLFVLVGVLFAHTARAQVYDHVACCYSDTGNCTVVPGQITPSSVDSSCAAPTSTAWLLEVQTTAAASNVHFVAQTSESFGWTGICPGIDPGFEDQCYLATGSPLFSNGIIKLVPGDPTSVFAYALNCLPKPPTGTCPAGLGSFDSSTCCGDPAEFQYGHTTTNSGFAFAEGTTQGLFTPAPPPPVPGSRPTTMVMLAAALVGLGLVSIRRRFA